MQTYQNAKCYDAQGYVTRTGVQVVICDDRVLIGDSTYPISDVTIDPEKRTITSPSGWVVEY